MFFYSFCKFLGDENKVGNLDIISVDTFSYKKVLLLKQICFAKEQQIKNDAKQHNKTICNSCKNRKAIKSKLIFPVILDVQEDRELSFMCFFKVKNDINGIIVKIEKTRFSYKPKLT